MQGKTEAQCLIQVSSLAVQVKQSSAQLLVRAMNRDLQALANAKVSIRDAAAVGKRCPERPTLPANCVSTTRTACWTASCWSGSMRRPPSRARRCEPR
ncbi:hypothetical protein [Methylomonas koyamae]|uniref:hypothetical protein n=1 Tax=Methylomonas koyamae TaxID=702114 RepID=UPI0021105355|nr:hypothetical protein [Methylomonas koyamae]